MLELVGRSSSHYTRVAQVFAHELGVPYRLVPVFDLTQLEADCYGDNPALKIPMLRESPDSGALFGAQNVCRRLVEVAATRPGSRPVNVIWPETLRSQRMRNANELLWHAMAAQVQLVFGLSIGQLDADNVYFAKARRGFIGALGWLEQNLSGVIEELPERDLSLFEVALFCLVDHLRTRESVPLSPYPGLVEFADRFSVRDSARRTPYRFDVPSD